MKKGLVKLVVLGLLVICMLPVAGTTSSDTGIALCSEENVLPNWVL